MPSKKKEPYRVGRFVFSPKVLAEQFAMGFMLDMLVNRGFLKTMRRRMRARKEPFIEIAALFE